MRIKRLLLVNVLVLLVFCLFLDSSQGKDSIKSKPNRELTDKESRRLLLQLKKRKKIYLRKNSTLSKSRYNELFSGKCDQENTKNCWVLAAFGAIPLDQREALFRTSFEKVGDAYEVRFPLGSSKAKAIRVVVQDLEPQITTEDGKEKIYRPVKSTTGWQILEAAFTLYQFGRDEKGQVDRQASNGGKAYNALRKLVPIQPSATVNIHHTNDPLSANEKRTQSTLERLAAYKPSISMYTASSLKKDPPFNVNPRHAYVVQMVDKETQRVMLINPHNSDRPLIFTYREFMMAFRGLYCMEISLEEMFR